MRIDIKTGGKPIKDKDLKAVYLLYEAIKMSTPRMVKANLEFATGVYFAKQKKK